MDDAGFSRFKATLNGVALGASILRKQWGADGVLRQLFVDGCPVGVGNVRVEGCPGDHFKVIRQDKQEIHFDNEWSPIN